MGADEKPFSIDALALPGRPLGVALSLLAFLTLSLLAAWTLASFGTHSFVFWGVAVLQAIAMGRTMVLVPRLRDRRVTVQVTGEGLAVLVTNAYGSTMGRDDVDRSSIRSAVVLRRADGRATLTLRDAAGKRLLALVAPTTETAQSVVDALALGSGARQTTFEGASPVGTTTTIGRDGIVMQSIFRKRFVAFRDVTRVERGTGSVAAWLVKANGARVPVPALSMVRDDRDEVLFSRIEEAHAAFERGGGPSVTAATLARAGRTTRVWVASLRKRLRQTDYRSPPVSDEALLAVMEDPTAPEDTRAAAAIALAESADREIVARIRVAADATASPMLRVALDAAASNDEEASVRAIAELSEETPSEVARAARRSK